MKIIILLSMSFISSSALAIGFTSVCDADGVHAYRNSTNISGELIPPEWSTEETFFNNWSFHYDGEIFSINGNQATVLFDSENHMVVSEGGLALDGESVSFWMYAINFKLNEIIGTQVNSYDSLGDITGIKSRAVNFKCSFSYH